MTTTDGTLLGAVVIYSGHSGLLQPEPFKRALAPVALDLVAKLRDGMAPAGALGKACSSGLKDPGYRWMSHGRSDGCSRWVRCEVELTDAELHLEGKYGVNVDSIGSLDFDPEVPDAVRADIRKAYEEHRGGIDARMLGSQIDKEMRTKRKGISGTKSGGVWLVQQAHTAGLEEMATALSKFGVTLGVLPWVDGECWKPRVEQAVVDDFDAAIKVAKEAIEKARSGKVKERSCSTSLGKLQQLHERMKVWSTAFAINLGQAEAKMVELKGAIRAEYDKALAETE